MQHRKHITRAIAPFPKNAPMILALIRGSSLIHQSTYPFSLQNAFAASPAFSLTPFPILTTFLPPTPPPPAAAHDIRSAISNHVGAPRRRGGGGEEEDVGEEERLRPGARGGAG